MTADKRKWYSIGYVLLIVIGIAVWFNFSFILTLVKQYIGFTEEDLNIYPKNTWTEYVYVENVKVTSNNNYPAELKGSTVIKRILPLTEGSSYSHFPIADAVIETIENDIKKKEEYIAYVQGSILKYGEVDPVTGSVVIYKPPLPLYEFPAKVGGYWQTQLERQTPTRVIGEVPVNTKILSMKDLKVADKLYKNCLEVQTSFSDSKLHSFRYACVGMGEVAELITTSLDATHGNILLPVRTGTISEDAPIYTVIFFDDFTNDLKKWQGIRDAKIAAEGDNKIVSLYGKKTSSLSTSLTFRQDKTITLKAQIISGELQIKFLPNYFFSIRPDKLKLLQGSENMHEIKTTTNPGVWHEIKIVSNIDNIEIYVDNALFIDAPNENSGNSNLEIRGLGKNHDIKIDSVKVEMI